MMVSRRVKRALDINRSVVVPVKSGTVACFLRKVQEHFKMVGFPVKIDAAIWAGTNHWCLNDDAQFLEKIGCVTQQEFGGSSPWPFGISCRTLAIPVLPEI